MIRGGLHFPSDHHLNIHTNLVWGKYLFEVVGETLLFPLYYLLGITIADKKETANKVKTSLLLFFAVYLVVLAVMYFAIDPIIMSKIHDLHEAKEVISYIRLEMVGLFFMSISKLLLVTLQLHEKNRLLLGYLATQIVTMVVFDMLFVATIAPFNLGIMGVGLTNLTVGLMTAIYAFIAVAIVFNFKEFRKERLSFDWFHMYLHIGEHAFIDAMLLNADRILFLLAIGKSFNGLLSIDSFFSVYVMLPIIALGDTLKCDMAVSINCHHKAAIIKENVDGYNVVNAIIIGLLVILSFTWLPSISELLHMHVLEESTIDASVYAIIPLIALVYGIKAFQYTYDSAFYGLGELDYLTKQSVWETVLVYLPAIILLKVGFDYSPILIVLVLGLAILVDAYLTLYYYRFMLNAYAEGKDDPQIHHYPIKASIKGKLSDGSKH
jgi:Na+-driven multidrug efflux pump